MDFKVTVTDHYNPPLYTFYGRLVLTEVLTEGLEYVCGIQRHSNDFHLQHLSAQLAE